MLTIHAIIGPVGSGKTTLFNAFDPERYVRFSSGTLCRNAVGIGMFKIRGQMPNAPPSLDSFVFNGFEQHARLALVVGRDMVCEFPRTRMQCEWMVEFLHRFAPARSAQVILHQLIVCERTWEDRLRASRWRERPELEEMDRARYADSVRDAVQSAAWCRAAGPPFVDIIVYDEKEEKKPRTGRNDHGGAVNDATGVGRQSSVDCGGRMERGPTTARSLGGVPFPSFAGEIQGSGGEESSAVQAPDAR